MKPQLNLDNLTHYRGYAITRNAYGVGYVHADYDGPPDVRCGVLPTIRAVVDAIDLIEDESDGE